MDDSLESAVHALGLSARCLTVMDMLPKLVQRRGDYGYDAPRQGLLPTGAGGVLFAALAALHQRTGRPRLARLELAYSVFLFLWFAMYLHTTRRGKFEVWAEILTRLPLRGDEQVLD